MAVRVHLLADYFLLTIKQVIGTTTIPALSQLLNHSDTLIARAQLSNKKMGTYLVLSSITAHVIQ